MLKIKSEEIKLIPEDLNTFMLKLNFPSMNDTSYILTRQTLQRNIWSIDSYGNISKIMENVSIIDVFSWNKNF